MYQFATSRFQWVNDELRSLTKLSTIGVAPEGVTQGASYREDRGQVTTDRRGVRTPGGIRHPSARNWLACSLIWTLTGNWKAISQRTHEGFGRKASVRKAVLQKTFLEPPPNQRSWVWIGVFFCGVAVTRRLCERCAIANSKNQ